MTRRSSINDTSIKFELPSTLRAEFNAACKREGISQAATMRLFIQEWVAHIAEVSEDSEVEPNDAA